MQFKMGKDFQSHDAQLIWNKIGSFNSGFKSAKPPSPKARFWSWGQVAGQAVAEFNRRDQIEMITSPVRIKPVGIGDFNLSRHLL